jgi:hypothetical protein
LSLGKLKKTAVWDVTVIHILATSNLSSTSITPGSAAEITAARKVDKHVKLFATHTFVPIALKTLSPISVQSLSFVREVGRRLSRATDDARESAFLFQRLSVAIQRFNAVCVTDTLGTQLDTE